VLPGKCWEYRIVNFPSERLYTHFERYNELSLLSLLTKVKNSSETIAFVKFRSRIFLILYKTTVDRHFIQQLQCPLTDGTRQRRRYIVSAHDIFTFVKFTPNMKNIERRPSVSSHCCEIGRKLRRVTARVKTKSAALGVGVGSIVHRSTYAVTLNVTVREFSGDARR